MKKDTFSNKIFNFFALDDNPLRRIDPLGLWTVDESCKCEKEKVEKATRKACSEQTISRLPRDWGNCVSRKCKELKVKCGGWLCDWQGGAGESIPLFGSTVYVCNPSGQGECSLANTVLHETLHKCGATDPPLSGFIEGWLGIITDAQKLADAAIPCN